MKQQMTIEEAKRIIETTKSYALRRDMLKYIKRKEREKWQERTTISRRSEPRQKQRPAAEPAE